MGKVHRLSTSQNSKSKSVRDEEERSIEKEIMEIERNDNESSNIMLPFSLN